MCQGKILLAGLLLLSPFSALAERKPVAAQIQLPHNYYYREMYLPQLTSGPSALTFSPDGKELVYSMGGSLWRQTIGDDQARELTHAGGYDYQPDWSHDGRHIIFTRYQKDAIELWQLDLQTGTEVALTSHGDINLEPRYSPDDRQVAFVSTAEADVLCRVPTCDVVLRHNRPCDQSFLDSRWSTPVVRLESGSRLWNR